MAANSAVAVQPTRLLPSTGSAAAMGAGANMPYASGSLGGVSGGGPRRPATCPSWMSREEFEVCKADPYRAYDIATTKIAELQQRVTVQKNINAALLQDPQFQLGQAIQSFEKLKGEHIGLNDQYNDAEAVNETLQEVIEVLRGDKHQLLIELNAIKRETTIQTIENAQLAMKHRQVLAYNESLDLKLRSQEAQLANLHDEIKDSSKQHVALANEVAALESTAQNLSLQSSSLSELRQHLETTRAAQDRAIQALEREVQAKVQEMIQHDAQLWEFKREMSGRVLALQKKAQECDDELGRLQRLSVHEMGTLASQNKALNDELKATADALFSTRKERTDFGVAAKKELTALKEEVGRCGSVVDLVERQNQGLEASIARLLEQNRLSERQVAEKDTINNKNVIEQTNFLSMIMMELQTTREDLYLLKARLCHHCREAILDDDSAEEKAAYQAAVAAGGKGGPGGSAAGGGGGSSTFGGGTNGSLQPLEFDQTSKPVVPNDVERGRVEQELQRLRDSLNAAQRQLLEERGLRDRERRQDDDARRVETDERAARDVEDEARRRRQKEDEDKARSEEMRTFTVRFMDGTRKKVDAFMSDTIGSFIARIAQKIGVSKSNLLYLAHSVNENSVLGAVDRFLDKSKTLEQENVTPKSTLVLKFKHYKRLLNWTDPVAQEWFYRQIHQNIITEYYPTREVLAVELAGLELQSVFGDATGRKRQSYFDRTGLDSYLPVSVSAHDYQYWQDRLYAAHKRRKGLSLPEARNRYIETFAQKCPLWGMTFFDVRDRENRPFLAGISEDGLYILNATKRDLLAVYKFYDLESWEKTQAGIFVRRRGNPKATLLSASALQAKEMEDLLNEYFMMLPYTVRESLGETRIKNREELRAKLPPAENFAPLIANRAVPTEFDSRLEVFKTLYMERCLGEGIPVVTKLTQLIDKALDEGRSLEDFDVALCEPPMTDKQFRAIVVVFEEARQYKVAGDYLTISGGAETRFVENIAITTISLAQSRGSRGLSSLVLPNILQLAAIVIPTNIVVLNLSNIKINSANTNTNSAEFAGTLSKCKKLKALSLNGCGLDANAFNVIFNNNLFQVQPSLLESLELRDNELNHTAVGSLNGFLQSGNSQLRLIALGFNKIEVNGIETLLASLSVNRRVDTLDISFNPGGVGAAPIIARFLRSAGSSSASSGFPGGSLSGPGVTSLNISKLDIKGEMGIEITRALRDRSQLRKLNFAENPLGATLSRRNRTSATGVQSQDLAAEFFSFLEVNSSSVLEELILDHCQLSPDAGQTLAGMLHNNTRLKTLVVSNNELATRGSGDLPSPWLDMLKANKTLSKLNLAYNRITYVGVKLLFASLASLSDSALSELKLDGNDLQSPQAQHPEIVSFLQNNKSLVILSLCSMRMPDSFLKAIGEGLQRNQALKRLLASNNDDLQTRGVREFARLLGSNTTLEFIDLSAASLQANDDMYLDAYKDLIEGSNAEQVLM